MEKFEVNTFGDLENCFVCGEYMGTFKNELSVNTAYSEKTILEIIEKFIESEVPDVVATNGGICQNCYIKFNEYDEFQSRAEAIQSEIFTMMTCREKFIECKHESINEQEEVIYTEYDENMVEIVQVMPEKYSEQYVSDPVLKPTTSSFALKVEAKLPPPPKRQPSVKTVERQKTFNIKDEGFLTTMIDDIKHYTCEICLKHFISRSRLKTHRQIHSATRSYKCDLCTATFKTPNCLKNHARLHMNKFWYCDICGSKFKGKHEIRCHMDAVHLLKRDHICQLCGKAFSRDKTLRQHLLYHMNERNIECEICGFKTINRPKMTRHLKSHTGERDYACSICGKKFLYSYNVSAHIRHVHYKEKRPQTDEGKLKCSICNKKFQKIWKVAAHMRSEHNIIEEMVVNVDAE